MARQRSSVSGARASPHVNSLVASASRTRGRTCSYKPSSSVLLECEMVRLWSIARVSNFGRRRRLTSSGGHRTSRVMSFGD
ncbi:hypothetical protein YC2023_069906 [Brassica napus]